LVEVNGVRRNDKKNDFKLTILDWSDKFSTCVCRFRAKERKDLKRKGALITIDQSIGIVNLQSKGAQPIGGHLPDSPCTFAM
jgi:hypothetical protein